jgi:hypothetical protein
MIHRALEKQDGGKYLVVTKRLTSHIPLVEDEFSSLVGRADCC